MKPTAPAAEKNFGKDLNTFEQLPTKTKELEILQDQGKKAIGEKKLTLLKLVREKSK